MQRQLFKNSFIYSLSTFVQKTLIFLLLPLYTRYMSPEEYGTVSVVMAATYVSSIFFTLGLDSAIIRFFYDDKYKDDFDKFFGTLICAITGLSIFNYGLLVTVLSPLLKVLYDDIPLYPYAYISIAVLLFQPVYNFCLSFLQAKKDAAGYTILSFVFFFFNVLLTVVLVVFLRMGAVGYIVAIAGANFVGFCFGLWTLRKNFVLSFNTRYLKDALRYSFPFIPHFFISQVSGDADRFIINKFLNTSAAGVYQLGFSLSAPIDIVANSIYRAFTPLFLQKVQSQDPEERASIDQSILTISFLFCLSGTLLAVFANDVVTLAFDPAFRNAAIVIPILAFAFILSGFYYLFSTMLFFDNKLTRFIPVCTLLSGLTTIALDFTLIPRIGMLGAALAVLVGRSILVVLAYSFATKNKTIKWPIWRISACLATAAGFAIAVVLLNYELGSAWWWLILRVVSVMMLIILLSKIMWGKWLLFFTSIREVILNLRRR